MEKEEFKRLTVDSKSRIHLGKLVPEGVISYKAYIDHETQEITLKPQVEIPAREAWLFKNKKALEQVRNGIKQSADGKTKYIGSFSKYLKEE